jgi:allantoinase
MRTAIFSNKVITEEGIGPKTVLIENGVIISVDDQLKENMSCEHLGDLILMAGIVDPHVHINEPGRTDWEGFDSATRAAMAGGITSLVEMPLNASPVTTTVEAFEEKIKAASNKLHVNCGFWGGVIPGNETELEPLAEKGILGFKAFLTHSGINDFPNVIEEDLRKAMPIIAKTGLPLLVHCEISSETPGFPSSSKSYPTYLSSRPRKWENDAISLMIRLCEEYQCRTHIVHLSSADPLEQIKNAKQRGLPLTVETSQHYLYFNAEDIPDGRPEYKCAPPIREKSNNDKLWDALKEGIIDFVATDHSPAPPEMKEIKSGDLMKAWGGIASLQFALPILWSAARERGFDESMISKWLCENPAKLPQLKKKGSIKAGNDADLVCWNPEEKFTVVPSMILHRHKICPYNGEELFGMVNKTWLSGQLIYDNTTENKAGNCLHLKKGHILYHG